MSTWLWWFTITVVLFLAYEIPAAVTKKFPTLSRTLWVLGQRYPILPFFIGLVTASLAWHFWGGDWCLPPY